MGVKENGVKVNLKVYSRKFQKFAMPILPGPVLEKRWDAFGGYCMYHLIDKM